MNIERRFLIKSRPNFFLLLAFIKAAILNAADACLDPAILGAPQSFEAELKARGSNRRLSNVTGTLMTVTKSLGQSVSNVAFLKAKDYWRSVMIQLLIQYYTIV